jgi:ribose transport system substrate-binding protein
MNLLRGTLSLAAALCLAALPACDKGGKPPEKQTYGKYVLHTGGAITDGASRTEATVNAQKVLAEIHQEQNICLIGLWAYNPPAILEAVRSDPKYKHAKIVGFDEGWETLDGIESGEIHGTVVQDPFNFGYKSVEILAAEAQGDTSKRIKEIPYRVVTKDGSVAPGEKNNGFAAAKFREDLKALLGSVKKGAPSAGKVKIGIVTNNPEEFWSYAEAGANKAAHEFGVELSFRRPERGDVGLQMDIVNQMVSAGFAGIAVSVIDPKEQTPDLNQIAKKVKLIAMDNDAPEVADRICYVGTDNYAAGRAVGRMVKQVMPQGGTIAIFVGQITPLNARQRRDGVLDELADKEWPK